MKQSCSAALGVSFMLLIAPAAELVTAGNEGPISTRAHLAAASYSANVLIPGRSGRAQGPDYKAQYPEEYAFFKFAFDKSNGEDLYGAERDSAFSIVVQKVEALQKADAKISLGGMLSLLIYEGQARLAHYNTLCRENSYDQSTNCWQDPKARYSYQLGLGAVHTSNFYPCSIKDRLWTQAQRAKFAQLAAQSGFLPTAEQIASVASELHQFCPSTQPEAVDYYVLRANDLGIPTNNNGNALTLEGKYPFFTPSIALAFFFAKLEGQPSQLTSDEKAICIWGATYFYCCPKNQVAILARWNQFAAHPQPTQVVVAGFQTIPAQGPALFNPSKDAYYLVPILIHDGSGYRFFPYQVPGEDPGAYAYQTGQRLTYTGERADLQNPIVREFISQTTLSRVKHFDVYRKGRKIGSFDIQDAVLLGPFGQVVGVGTPTGFSPSNEDIAIAGAPIQQDLVYLLPPSRLSLTQTRQLDSMVASLFPKTMPANQIAPTVAGQPLRLKTSWENLNILDPECNGNLVVSLERTAAITSIASPSFTARSFLLAHYNTQMKSFDKLASWVVVTQGNNIVFSKGTGDEFLLTFKGVLDVTGDGICKLILLKGIPGGGPELLVYEFQNGKLHLVGARGWEVGFELTIPETISGLYGKD